MLSPLLIALDLCTKILSLVIIVIYEKYKKMLLYIITTMVLSIEKKLLFIYN
ncbi:hypothetical protein ND00_01970 [Clostridium sp. L74]|nr:hypothetical protein ND00_01970 [Clostridium sp. L74]